LSDLGLQSTQQLQQPQMPPGNISVLFSNLSSPLEHFSSLLAAHQKFAQDFATSSATMKAEDMVAMVKGVQDLQENLKTIKTSLQSNLLRYYLEQIEAMIASLEDPEAPDLGRQFISRLRKTDCKTVIDTELECAAAYRSYSYAESNYGFANTIALQPSRLDDIIVMVDAIVHEVSHGFQVPVAPALQLSPFNPDTRVLVHPADWIMLDNLCERDAYAKQALFNYLLNKANPEVRVKSQKDMVTVEDFENAREKHGTLQKALTAVALDALNKVKTIDKVNLTFAHHYYGEALTQYENGMAMRKTENETGHIFVRLEPKDLYAVGAYDVGPNSLGKYNIHPDFRKRPDLTPQQQERYRILCDTYNIPPLEECVTLAEHNQGISNRYPQNVAMEAPLEYSI